MTGEQNGPLQADGVTPVGGGITTQQAGPQPQRARLRASRAPFGLLSAPSRTIRVAVRSLCTPQAPVNDVAGNAVLTSLDTCLNNAAKTANGLMAGEYTAPTFEYIFPENVKPGDALVPFDFWHLPFLRYGEGSTTASSIGPGVGPLEPTPWSGISASIPGAPVIGAATATATTATATWAPPVSDGGAPITSYTVTMLDGAGNPAGTQTVAGNISTATFTGLPAGATFSFKVSATNLLGTGPDSAASNRVTLVAPATTTAPVVSLKVPSGPVSTTAVPVTLSWTGTNASAYELQQSVGGAAFADIATCTAAAPCVGTSATVNVKASPTNGAVTTYRLPGTGHQPGRHLRPVHGGDSVLGPRGGQHQRLQLRRRLEWREPGRCLQRLRAGVVNHRGNSPEQHRAGRVHRGLGLDNGPRPRHGERVRRRWCDDHGRPVLADAEAGHARVAGKRPRYGDWAHHQGDRPEHEERRIDRQQGRHRRLPRAEVAPPVTKKQIRT